MVVRMVTKGKSNWYFKYISLLMPNNFLKKEMKRESQGREGSKPSSVEEW